VQNSASCVILCEKHSSPRNLESQFFRAFRSDSGELFQDLECSFRSLLAEFSERKSGQHSFSFFRLFDLNGSVAVLHGWAGDNRCQSMVFLVKVLSYVGMVSSKVTTPCILILKY
jgi:hypothetical protein